MVFEQNVLLLNTSGNPGFGGMPGNGQKFNPPDMSADGSTQESDFLSGERPDFKNMDKDYFSEKGFWLNMEEKDADVFKDAVVSHQNTVKDYSMHVLIWLEACVLGLMIGLIFARKY